jgi:hypothetical protein
VSEEHTASVFKVEEYAVKDRTFSELQGATTHNNALFAVTAVRASNLVFIDPIMIINLTNLQSLVLVLKNSPSPVLPSNLAKLPVHQHNINRMHEFLAHAH